MAAPHRPPPEPLQTHDLKAVLVGIAVWSVALVILLARAFSTDGDSDDRWVWVCLAGLVLGAVGVRHVRRRSATDRDENQPADAGLPKE